MKFVAPEQAPEQAEIIRNTPFWPDVDLSEFRSVMRTDGTVTQPRLKQVALPGKCRPWSLSCVDVTKKWIPASGRRAKATPPK